MVGSRPPVQVLFKLSSTWEEETIIHYSDFRLVSG